MSSNIPFHNILSRSDTPNCGWTDNPVYWNKYEREAVGLPDKIDHLVVSCQSCSERFIPAVAGQSFCSEECYVPPCSICDNDLGLLAGDNPMTFGLHLCAGCYWDAEEKWRHERALGRKNAPRGGYTEEDIARLEDEALEKMYAEEHAFQELKAEVENSLDEARHANLSNYKYDKNN